MTTTQHRPVALGEATVGELAQSVRGQLLGPQAEDTTRRVRSGTPRTTGDRHSSCGRPESPT